MDRQARHPAAVPKLLLAALTFAFLTSGARAGSVPVPLGDLDTHPPSGSPFHPFYPFGAPRDLLSLGERVLFATDSSYPEGQCLLWAYSPRTGAVRRLGGGEPSITSGTCFASLGVIDGVAYYRSPLDVLWRSDGTPAGTGPIAGLDLTIESPLGVVVTDAERKERLIFSACDEDVACGLWRTDGTSAGTTPLRDDQGGQLYRTEDQVLWRGDFYFLARSSRSGLGVWRTDGSDQGTRLLGAVQEDDELVPHLAATPSRLFFTSFGSSSDELWVSDGSREGTHLLRTFRASPCFPHVGCDQLLGELVAEGDEVVFPADDGEHGVDLWASDATEAGTRRLTDLPEESRVLMPSVRRFGSRWVFLVWANASAKTVSLWSSLGDPATTAPIVGAFCAPDCPKGVGFFRREDQPPGRLVYVAEDLEHGREVWSSDGTPEGTRRLTDACPGTCSAFIASHLLDPEPTSALAGRLFLSLRQSDAPPGTSVDEEEWSTDGTPEGTERLLDLPFGGVAPFADGGIAGTTGGAPAALRLWTTDGTEAGTRLAATFLEDRERSDGSSPAFIPTQNGALFVVLDGDQERLFTTDGTPGGTRTVPGGDASILGFPTWAAGFRCGKWTFLERWLAAGSGSFVSELWRSDGTPGSTVPIARFPAGLSIDRELVTEWLGRCLFPLLGEARPTLWVSDGTPTGTRQLFALPQGMHGPDALLPFGARFLFLARQERRGRLAPQLFVSDGTRAGTRQLTAVTGDREEIFEPFARVGPRVYFLIPQKAEEVESLEIWVTDGTEAGTRRLFTQFPHATELTSFRGSLYFVDADPDPFVCGRRLYRFRPGDVAPVLLASLRWSFANCAGFLPSLDLTPIGPYLFFGGSSLEEGRELWRTDGTPEGTRPVRDLRPGPESSDPLRLTAAGSRLYFTARDDAHGRELWTSDGTFDGTRLVADLNPGIRSAMAIGPIDPLVVSVGRVYFDADDGVHGIEPWVLTVEP